MADEKDNSLIITGTGLVLPDAEALVQHGGMTIEAAGIATRKNPLAEFGLRRAPNVDLNAQFHGAVIIGGAGETPVVPLGAVYKLSDMATGTFEHSPAILIPTTEQVKAVREGGPVIVAKREPGG